MPDLNPQQISKPCASKNCELISRRIITSPCIWLPWRNWLARSTVNRKVGGSSPPGSGLFLNYFSLLSNGDLCRLNAENSPFS